MAVCDSYDEHGFNSPVPWAEVVVTCDVVFDLISWVYVENTSVTVDDTWWANSVSSLGSWFTVAG